MAKRSAAAAVRQAGRRAARHALPHVSSRRPRGTGPTMIQRSRAVSAVAKAAFNTEGRVPRDFFALSAADEAAIEARVEAFIDQALEE